MMDLKTLAPDEKMMETKHNSLAVKREYRHILGNSHEYFVCNLDLSFISVFKCLVMLHVNVHAECKVNTESLFYLYCTAYQLCKM